jgi:hypothetical protein
MNVRPLFFAAAGTLTLSLASAQVDYVGQITIPDGHDIVIRQGINPSSAGDSTLYLVTTKEIYLATPPATGNTFAWPKANNPANPAEYITFKITFGSSVLLATAPIAINTGEQGGNPSNMLIMSGVRSGLYSFNLTAQSRQNVETVNPPTGPYDAMAYQATTGKVLIAKGNQIFARGLNNYEEPWPLLFGSTGTGNTQFVNLTEMAFSGNAFGGLLFTLDWGDPNKVDGKQQVKVFDIDDPDGNYFRYAFDLPDSLELTNPDGHGVTINNYGHLFIADGRGGGMEFSLTGDLLATFSPPADELYGANNGLTGFNPAPYDASLDATFITHTSDGNLFVMDGDYGLHWYRDTAAYSVPEPAACAALAATATLGFAACRRRRK